MLMFEEKLENKHVLGQVACFVAFCVMQSYVIDQYVDAKGILDCCAVDWSGLKF